jgi:hypothetical protein
MAQTTFEQAKLCQRCGQPGMDVGTSPSKKPGVKVHSIRCDNERCVWYNTVWLVQVNQDGSVPVADHHQERQFPTNNRAAAMASDIDKALSNQLAQEIVRGPDGEALEVRNPRSTR